jgi:hypothetical protein
MNVADNNRQAQVSCDDARWVHPSFQPLATDRNGPFLVLPDDQLLTADTDGLLTSADEGRTWAPLAPAAFGQDPREPASFYLLRTRTGTLVMVYLEIAQQHFSWDDEAGEPKEDCRLEMWAVRSLDDGRTWVDRQRLLDGYNANFFGFLQIRGGRLVAVAEHLVTQPARWVACSLFSDDEGRTWRRSNPVDLGGHGHHDGATEPMLAELSDGRLLMLIRTNLGRFWEAFSEDGGRYWRTIRPSTIEASSAPGCLLRLESGRLVLVWNRPAPEGGIWPLTPPGPATEVAASWYREELSIAVSEDDGHTWAKPLVLARQVGGQLSYPFLLERRPGELWITAGFAFRRGWEDPLPLRVRVGEEELVALVRGDGGLEARPTRT